MEESILDTIKKMLGLEKDYTPFDQDIIIDINSEIAHLRQIGVGPQEGFEITGSDETWSELVEDSAIWSMVKTLMYLRVRMLFDPPTNSFLSDAIEKQAAELEWRLNVEAEGSFNQSSSSSGSSSSSDDGSVTRTTAITTTTTTRTTTTTTTTRNTSCNIWGDG